MTDPTAILVAGSLQHAMRSAVEEWGWKRVGFDLFETPDGEQVKYVADRQGNLLNRPAGTRVYFGFGVWMRRDENTLWALIHTGRFTLAIAEDGE